MAFFCYLEAGGFMTTETKPKTKTTEGAQLPGASSPQTAAPADVTLLARVEALEKVHKEEKAEWERQVKVLTRERDSVKKASELDPNAIDRLADMEEARDQIAERFELDPEDVPLADYRTMNTKAREKSERIKARIAEGRKSLESEIGEIKAKLSESQSGGLPNPSGSIARQKSANDVMDDYIHNPTPETRKAYEAIRTI